MSSFPWSNGLLSLHYADDTLLLVPGDAKSLISLNLIIYAFKMMIGLKINFHKSYIYNLNRCVEVGTRAASRYYSQLQLRHLVIYLPWTTYQSDLTYKGRLAIPY